MISIGIDVSKRKSTVAIINVMGEILQTPFDIEHSQIGLQKLWDLIKDYPKDQVKYHYGGHRNISLRFIK